jgi:hypothetical protein
MAAGACTFGARLCPCFVSLRLPVFSSRRLPHYELVIRCASVGGKKKNSSSSSNNKRSQTSSGSGFGTKIAAKPCKQKIPFPKLLASLACLLVNLELAFHFPSRVFKTVAVMSKLLEVEKNRHFLIYLLVLLPHSNACVVSAAIRKCIRNCE